MYAILCKIHDCSVIDLNICIFRYVNVYTYIRKYVLVVFNVVYISMLDCYHISNIEPGIFVVILALRDSKVSFINADLYQIDYI